MKAHVDKEGEDLNALTKASGDMLGLLHAHICNWLTERAMLRVALHEISLREPAHGNSEANIEKLNYVVKLARKALDYRQNWQKRRKHETERT